MSTIPYSIRVHIRFSIRSPDQSASRLLFWEAKAGNVIGLLEKLNLSATERKSIRLCGAVIGSQQGDPQAVGKVMVEKTC